MIGDGGYPYGIPLDHWYDETNGKLYFHCAKEGQKLDAIEKDDKVSYCVCDKGFRREGEWAAAPSGSRLRRSRSRAGEFFPSPGLRITAGSERYSYKILEHESVLTDG